MVKKKKWMGHENDKVEDKVDDGKDEEVDAGKPDRNGDEFLQEYDNLNTLRDQQGVMCDKCATLDFKNAKCHDYNRGKCRRADCIFDHEFKPARDADVPRVSICKQCRTIYKQQLNLTDPTYLKKKKRSRLATILAEGPENMCGPTEEATPQKRNGATDGNWQKKSPRRRPCKAFAFNTPAATFHPSAVHTATPVRAAPIHT